jgi:hypothetical protein
MQVAKTLAQLIAVERKTRQQDNDAGKEARKRLTQERVTGLLTEYKPDLDDEALPNSMKSTSTHQPVQSKVTDELAVTRQYAEAAINIVASKDATNMDAEADIVLPDGTVLMPMVGISHLLWLENYFTEWRGFLASLPVLSSAKEWKKHSSEAGIWVSDTEKTPKTVKETEALVLHPGNDRHPPQVTTVQKDNRIGLTHKTVHSGAIKDYRRRELLDRCDTLIKAIREAIAKANQTPATEVTDEGAALMGYLLG